MTAHDLVFAVWTGVLKISEICYGYWKFGEAFCRLNKVANTVSFIVMMILHYMLTYERYRDCIKKPMAIKTVKRFIGLAWVIALGYTAPLFALLTADDVLFHIYRDCERGLILKNPIIGFLYLISYFVCAVGFAISTFYLNVKIIKLIYRKRRQIDVVAPNRVFSVIERHGSESLYRYRANSTIRIAKITIILTMYFVMSYVTRLVAATAYNSAYSGFKLLNKLTFYGFYLNSIIDPLIYAAVSPNFRQRCRDTFKCSKRKKRELLYMGNLTVSIEPKKKSSKLDKQRHSSRQEDKFDQIDTDSGPVIAQHDNWML
ncbi:uncharacterized protein LOC144444308 [Glandiceps talaboti]